MMDGEDNKEKDKFCVNNCEHVAKDEMSKDPIAEIIGDVGKWQIQRILLFFIISLPGLALIFSVPFVFNKTDFWCDENIDDNINSQNATLMGAKKLGNITVKNQCMDDCKKYIFDTNEWTKTLIMEWEMVCHRNHLQGTRFARLISFYLEILKFHLNHMIDILDSSF